MEIRRQVVSLLSPDQIELVTCRIAELHIQVLRKNYLSPVAAAELSLSLHHSILDPLIGELQQRTASFLVDGEHILTFGDLVQACGRVSSLESSLDSTELNSISGAARLQSKVLMLQWLVECNETHGVGDHLPLHLSRQWRKESLVVFQQLERDAFTAQQLLLRQEALSSLLQHLQSLVLTLEAM